MSFATRFPISTDFATQYRCERETHSLAETSVLKLIQLHFVKHRINGTVPLLFVCNSLSCFILKWHRVLKCIGKAIRLVWNEQRITLYTQILQLFVMKREEMERKPNVNHKKKRLSQSIYMITKQVQLIEY